MEVVCAQCGRAIARARIDEHLHRAFCAKCDRFTPLAGARKPTAEAIREAFAPTREIVPLPNARYRESIDSDEARRIVVGGRLLNTALTFAGDTIVVATTRLLGVARWSIDAMRVQRCDVVRVDSNRGADAVSTASWDVRLTLDDGTRVDLDLRLDLPAHANFVASRIEAALARGAPSGYRGERA